MSDNPQPIPLGAPNSANAPATRSDQVVSVARDIPDLIAKAEAFDPALAAKFTGQALVWSRTPWGTIAGGAVSWFAAHYGLACGTVVTSGCWSPETQNLLGGLAAGFGCWVGAYIMRSISDGPITGWFRKATVDEAIAAQPKTQGATP